MQLRKHLVKLLKGGNAYSPFEEIVADFPEDHMNTLFPNGSYNPWELLEHIRLTQEDILDFMINSDYSEPNWPVDYWPKTQKKVTKKDWVNTIKQIKQDIQKTQEMVMNRKIDLYAKVPKGDGQTFLREFLLVADHNSYHLGEFSIMRQVMRTWRHGHT